MFSALLRHGLRRWISRVSSQDKEIAHFSPQYSTALKLQNLRTATNEYEWRDILTSKVVLGVMFKIWCQTILTT